jgi:hypothetical protein
LGICRIDAGDRSTAMRQGWVLPHARAGATERASKSRLVIAMPAICASRFVVAIVVPPFGVPVVDLVDR